MGYQNIIMVIVSLLLSGIVIKTVSPSMIEQIKSNKVETQIIEKQKRIVDSVIRYIKKEKSFPTNMLDLANKGYFLSVFNNNGFGGTFEFTIENNKGLIYISTTITDEKVKSLLINSKKNTFKSYESPTNTIITPYIFSTEILNGNKSHNSSFVAQDNAPDATLNKYWYDTSGEEVVLKISNGSSWIEVLNVSQEGTVALGVPISNDGMDTYKNKVDLTNNNLSDLSSGGSKLIYDTLTNTMKEYININGLFYEKEDITMLKKSFKYIMGSYSSCGIEVGTDLGYCWGLNNYGQLGDNTTTNRLILTAIDGSKQWQSISSGYNSTCGIEVGTNLGYCWGYNGAGQLGDNTTTNRLILTAIDGSKQWQSISSGYNSTCGIEVGTNLGYCWGYNGAGQLGDNTTTQKLIPTAISGSKQWQSISSSGDSPCGIEVGTNLGYCWGRNSNGQLGDNTTIDKLTPTAISGSKQWQSISSGYNSTCGIEVGTNLGYCWGRNSNGQLGDNTTTQRLIPKAISGSKQWQSISSSGDSTCGIELTTNLGYCWGLNNYGQLGDNTTTDKLTPTAISGSKQWQSISSGYNSTCGIEVGTNLGYCWGYNIYGELGDNTTTQKLIPTAIK
jgi:alpha-tubulin suppressor-like RCC1 family protein